MDKWKDQELNKMRVGGNKLAREFFEEEEINWSNMSIHQKYNSKAAALYREKILALAENREWSYDATKAELERSSNNASLAQSKSSSAISSFHQQDSYQQDSSYQHINTQEFRDQKEYFFNNLQSENAQRSENLPPNQGGRYAGFGNTVQSPPTRSQSEIFDTTLSSLSSGWSLLSLGASKVKDNAVKYGSLASQKVVDTTRAVTQNVSEKVFLLNI